MKNLATILAVISFAAFANLALADWAPGGPYKMHFPQLPNFADVFTLTEKSPAAFGWKTADVRQYPPPNTGQHFMDDAVWIDVNTFFVSGGPGRLAGPAGRTVKEQLAHTPGDRCLRTAARRLAGSSVNKSQATERRQP